MTTFSRLGPPAAVLVAIAVALAGLPACGHLSPEQAVHQLDDVDPGARRNAADALKPDVPPEAIPKLIALATKDPVSNVRGAAVIALGRSGAPEAKAAIEEYAAKASTPDEQRWAERAKRAWATQSQFRRSP